MDSLEVGRAYLGEAGIETETALFESSHLLKAKRHVMHRALNQEPIHCISLKHQPIKQRLSFLEQTQRSIILLLRNKVNGRVIQLMQN